MSEDWNISLDPITLEVKIVNKRGSEMDHKTLTYLFDKLDDFMYRTKEKEFGPDRREPIDEFTKKRLNLKDYALAQDEIAPYGRVITEIYHDDNEILTINRFTVLSKRKRVSQDFTAHLLRDEAEKILPTIQSFVDSTKRENK
ncbi:hypothetical protein ACI5FR_25180 [Paenibacillus sp. HJGM_3]